MSATISDTPKGPPPEEAASSWEPPRMHFDPWCKMRFGWSEPRIVSLRAGGRFDLPAATSKKAQAPVIVYDPNHARRYHEYFILEYRSNAQQAPNYDTWVNKGASLDSEREGLLIWHVATADDHSLHRPLWQPEDPALDHSYPDGRPFGYSSSILARCPPDLGVWHNRPWLGGQTTPPLRWFNGTATQTRIHVLPFTPGASSITVEILPEQEVWVDFAFPGLPQYPELGNFDFPFNTLNEGISRVGYRGPLWIKAGRSAETVTGLGKPMTIHAYDREVTLGR